MKKPQTRKRRVLRRVLAAILVLALLCGGAWLGIRMLREEYKVTYDTYTATTGSISNALSFTGNLQPVSVEYSSATAETTVRTLYVKAGDTVSEDDPIVRLGNGSTIRAGISGRVNNVYVEEGDTVGMGANLAQIADFTRMKVSVRVDEYDIAKIGIGQKCRVTVVSSGLAYESEIAAIDYISSGSGNVAYYTVTLYVDLNDDGTLPGMQVSVSVPQEEVTDAVILKMDAVSFDITNNAYVWMMDDAEELKQIPITTGVSNGSYVEIKEGLSAGDTVYVEAEKEETSALTGLLSGLFGSRQFSSQRGFGDMGSFGGNMGGFNGGNMPDMGGFGGDTSGGGSSSFGGTSGGRSGNSGGGRQ